LAAQLDRIDQAFVVRQEKLLLALGLPVKVPDIDVDALMSAMQRDKKVEHGKLRFVLPSRLGHVELVGGISAEDVRRAWRNDG
jgi:3-dehydroquinate synthase